MNATDPHRLDGRRILVTGAARGIGRATAHALAAAGARLHLLDLREAELAEVADELGPPHTTAVVDLARPDDITRACETAHRALGGLDGVAHVAGTIRRLGLDEVTEADWDHQVDVNLKATFFVDREAARLMGPGGSIVNFTSQGWWTGGYDGSVVYAATKGGVVSLTRGLARSLADRGIRVNAVAPGGIETAMMSEGLTEADRSSFVAQVPFGRLGTPDEVAHAVTFLLSPASSYMTGTVLNVSGGQLAY